VYQTKCQVSGKKYVGCTQQHLKKRIQQHENDVKNLYQKGFKSDSFANHFAKNIPKKTQAKKIKKFIRAETDILWQGDPISCVKTFGTKSCKLCNQERLAILKLTRKTPTLAINTCTEIYGACRHRPRFHRFNTSSKNAPTSTDESRKDERVPRPDSTTSASSASSQDTTGSFDSLDFNDKREDPVFILDHPETNDFGFVENCINGHLARAQIDPKPNEETVIDDHRKNLLNPLYTDVSSSVQ
jgi:predicted GIY-YIG superfamily endonuclease